jgi:diacylglycerol kinase
MTKISFIDSTLCATRGLFKGISNERNIKIQILIGMLLIFTAAILEISKIYLITIIIVCFLVVILELFNMGFERLIDLVSPEYNKDFGRVKDAMAGVVLLTFGLAAIVSFIILYQPVLNLLKIMMHNNLSAGFIIANIFLIFILIIIEHFKKNNRQT